MLAMIERTVISTIRYMSHFCTGCRLYNYHLNQMLADCFSKLFIVDIFSIVLYHNVLVSQAMCDASNRASTAS